MCQSPHGPEGVGDGWASARRADVALPAKWTSAEPAPRAPKERAGLGPRRAAQGRVDGGGAGGGHGGGADGARRLGAKRPSAPSALGPRNPSRTPRSRRTSAAGRRRATGPGRAWPRPQARSGATRPLGGSEVLPAPKGGGPTKLPALEGRGSLSLPPAPKGTSLLFHPPLKGLARGGARSAERPTRSSGPRGRSLWTPSTLLP